MWDRITGKLNRIGNDVIFKTGLFAGNRLKDTEHTILMYHGIDRIGSTEFNSRHTAKDDFARHIKFLQKYCHIISLHDFFQEKFIKGRPNIALTFDDGYRNNFLYAKPILEEAKAFGTFYITGLNTSKNDILWADFLNIASILTDQTIVIDGESFSQKNGKYHSLESGKNLYSIIKDEKADFSYKQLMMESFTGLPDFKNNSAFDDYWKLMSNDEIVQCGNSKFIEVGSHGFLHNNLGTLSLELATKELSDSKDYLENLTQQKILSIGYPDGSYTREALDAGEKLGFLYQTAAEGFLFTEDETDTRIRDRKGVYSCDSCANDLMINL
jgi:peptidoglycan/xylan/chitin deacetylase (PgdA/CDA1 family)